MRAPANTGVLKLYFVQMLYPAIAMRHGGIVSSSMNDRSMERLWCDTHQFSHRTFFLDRKPLFGQSCLFDCAFVGEDDPGRKRSATKHTASRGILRARVSEGQSPGVMNIEAKSEAPAIAPTRPVLTSMRRSTSVRVGIMSMYWHIYSPAAAPPL